MIAWSLVHWWLKQEHEWVMASQPVYPHPPPLLDTPAVCKGNFFIFISSPPSLPHILTPSMDACYATNCLSSTSLPRKKKERRKKTPQFLTKYTFIKLHLPISYYFLQCCCQDCRNWTIYYITSKSPIPNP